MLPAACALLLLMLLLTLWVQFNIRGWPRPSVRGSGEPLPFVSVLVPARNEEGRIVRCLESLLRQEYPDFEVICLDDRSEDLTPELLAGLQIRFPRLRVLPGRELPAGWVGKCHACHQLAEHASGDWLLFTDADTVHTPDMLATLVRTAQQRRADLLSGFPRVLSSHAFGWIVLPLLFFVIVLHLPLRQVERSRDPRFMAAHGAFMLYRRSAYAAIGGHEAHRRALVEDMEMARAVKRAGGHAVLADITGHVSCEMYERSSEIWDGFAKNIFTGTGRSAPLLLVLGLLYAALYIMPLPAAALLWGTGHSGTALCCAGMLLLGWMQKAFVDRRFGVPGAWFLLLPISMLSLLLLGLRSWLLAVRGRGYVWKGRRYHP